MLSSLQAKAWPGNVRELKNVLERCLLLNASVGQSISGTVPQARNNSIDTRNDGIELLEDLEKMHILRILEQENGNKSAAARKLGISRKTLERKVQAWEAER